MKDLSNSIATALSHKSAVTTAASNGTGVDLKGYESATILVDVGAEGDTLSGSVFFSTLGIFFNSWNLLFSLRRSFSQQISIFCQRTMLFSNRVG